MDTVLRLQWNKASHVAEEVLCRKAQPKERVIRQVISFVYIHMYCKYLFHQFVYTINSRIRKYYAARLNFH